MTADGRTGLLGNDRPGDPARGVSGPEGAAEKPRRAYVETYGCQMNVHESEILLGLLEEAGYRQARRPEEADLIVVNTCCVREKAEERILGRLGELQGLKRRRPGLILAVAGCMSQQEGAAERILRRARLVDIIMGTHNLHRLPDLVRKVAGAGGRPRAVGGPEGRGRGGPVVEVWPEEREGIPEDLPVRRGPGVRAWVSIIHGCSNFCSYCIVPYVRGRERSRLPQHIRQEVETLAAEGYREVYLLGQNVNVYGRDLHPSLGASFGRLLRDLDRVDGLRRIRYTTSHPRDFTGDIIEAVAEGEKVCENFHLPAQSGSNQVLEWMNRGYSREDYLRLVERIRRRVPGATFSTDLIVGYPGETEKDFADTLDLVRQARFDSAFMFAYSPRRGTPAARRPDQVPEEVKQERLRRLIKVQNDMSLELNRAAVGSRVEVLVEGPADKDPHRAAGRSRGNKLVVFTPVPGTAPADLVGREVTVLVEQARTWSLEGRALA